MMKHPSDELTRLISGDLHEPRLSEVRAHVRQCTACQAAYDRLAMLEDRLHALPRLVPPHDFVAQLHARVAHLPPPPARPQPWLPLLAVIGGAIAIAWSFPDLMRVSAAAALPPWTDVHGWLVWIEQISAQSTIVLTAGACALAGGCLLLVRSLANMLPPSAGHGTEERVRA